MQNESRKESILIVDDDREILDLLSRFLSSHGFNVTTAGETDSALKQMKASIFDLIVLDLMLPGEDGLSFCRRIRSQVNTPIVMLTALGEETDRIVGLELGADDYLPKPFNPRELLARIKAVLRRYHAPNTTPAEQSSRKTAVFDNWQLDLARRELKTRDGLLTSLTAGEYELLLAFVENPQRVLNRDQLLDITRGRSAGPFDRSIDVQLSRLRKKIELDPKSPKVIKTVRNGGYIFTPAVKYQACE